MNLTPKIMLILKESAFLFNPRIVTKIDIRLKGAVQLLIKDLILTNEIEIKITGTRYIFRFFSMVKI